MTDDPIARFADWYAAAGASEPNDPNACALATIGADGWPQVRIVLVKAFDARGFVFYTNLRSAKGRALAANPRAALAFHWKTLRRQVRVSGTVAPVDDAEAGAYFATRPRASQLSAWASAQSERLESRDLFEARLSEEARRFPGMPPRPPHWTGLRVAPERIEFWEDRDGRQHHRELYEGTAEGWERSLRFP